MILQVVSVIGAVMILIAYGMIQNGIWRELNPNFLALNLIGSILLGIVAVYEQQAGFIILECVWSIMALFGVARALKVRTEQTKVS